MFNRFIAETYSKVRSKADEVRQSVAVHAAKAREALGLPTMGLPSAAALERALESQVAQATTMASLHDMYVRWIAQMVTATTPDAPLYADHPQTLGGGPLRVLLEFGLTAPATLGEAPPAATGPTSVSVSPGDICSLTTWISAPTKPPAHPPPPPPPPSDEGRPPPPPPPVSTPPVTAAGAAEPGYGQHIAEGEGLTFRDVFLRSQVLELALLGLARLDAVRSRFVVPIEEARDDEISTRGTMRRLMSLTLSGDARVQQELLFLLCSVDLKSDAWELQLRHLAELVAILKTDWCMAHLTAKKQRLQEEIEVLQHHVAQQEEAASSPTREEPPREEPPREEDGHHLVKRADSSLDRVHPTTTASVTRRKIVGLMLELEKTVEHLEARKKAVDADRARRLEQLRRTVEALGEKFAALGTQAADRGELLAQEMVTATQSAQEKYAAAEAEHTVLEVQISELEEKRQRLLEELDALNQKLTETFQQQQKARQTLQKLDSARQSVSRTLEQKAALAAELKRQSHLHKLDMENVQKLITQTEEGFQKEKEGIVAQPSQKAAILASAVAYVSSEVDRLRHQGDLLEKALSMARQLREVLDEKEKAHSRLRETFQERHETYLKLKEPEQQEEEVEAKADASVMRQKLVELETQFQALQDLARRCQDAQECVTALNDQVFEAQRHALDMIKELDLIWSDLNNFMDVLSHRLLLQPGAQQQPSGREQPPTPPDEKFVDIGEEVGTDRVPPLTHPQDTAELRALMAKAYETYTGIKKRISEEARILGAPVHTADNAQ